MPVRPRTHVEDPSQGAYCTPRSNASRTSWPSSRIRRAAFSDLARSQVHETLIAFEYLLQQQVQRHPALVPWLLCQPSLWALDTRLVVEVEVSRPWMSGSEVRIGARAES